MNTPGPKFTVWHFLHLFIMGFFLVVMSSHKFIVQLSPGLCQFPLDTVSKNSTSPLLLPQEASPWWTATQVLGWWRPRLPPQPPTRSVTSTGWTRAARSTRGRETWRLICDRTSTWWNRRRGSPWYYRARSVKQMRSGEINTILSSISSSDSRLLDTAGLQKSHDDSSIFPINDVCVTGLIP